MTDIEILPDPEHLPEPIMNDRGKMVDAWIIGDDGKPHHIVAEPGQHILRNGAIKDDETGHFVKRGVLGNITADNAKDKLARLQECKTKAAIRAISSADTDKRSISVGLETLFAAQVAIALNNPAYSTKAAEFVLKHAGLDVKQSSDDAPGLTLHVDADTAMRVIQALDSRKNKSV